MRFGSSTRSRLFGRFDLRVAGEISGLDRMELLRARLATGFPLVYGVVGLLLIVAYLWAGLDLLALLIGLSIPPVILLPWIIRHTSIRVGAHVFGAVFTGLITAAAVALGPLHVLSTLWLGALVLYCTFVGGRKVARTWAILGLTSVTLVEISREAGLLAAIRPTAVPAPVQALIVAMMVLVIWVLSSLGDGATELIVQRLQESHARLEQAHALASLGTWSIDGETLRVHLSREVAGFLGQAKTDISLDEYLGCVVPEDREESRRRILAQIEEGTSAEGYRSILQPDGSRRVLHFVSSCQVDMVGRRTVTGYAQDVTEQKRVEEELIRAREGALAASRAKSEFLANMSHEIRTPLNGVLGMLQLVLDGPLDLATRESLATAPSCGEGLLGVLNDILDLSKVEAGQLDLEDAEFELSHLAEDVRDVFSASARQKGLRVELEVDEGARGKLRGDPLRIRQILMNLVGNAVKFTSAGKVLIRVLAPEGSAVRILVSDTGPGIPADRLDAIFDAFQQVDGSTTRRFGGTGLGLTIARKLAVRMGGSLSVDSAIGRGSTFTFRAPLARVRPRSVPPPADPKLGRGERGRVEPGARERLRILVAEDNTVNARVMTHLLERAGHEVVHVADGRRAVDRATSERFDLVLMDVQMPELDGYEAAATIRAREGALAHTPIVALTANAMKGDREHCLEAGMDAYLAKPVNPAKLKQLIRQLTGRAPPTVGSTSNAPPRTSSP